MRQVTTEHRRKIQDWEGCILFVYDDADPPSRRRRIKQGDPVKGTLTIGYGHTGADVKPGLTITQADAERLFDHDLDRFERIVENSVKVPLSDAQFATLVSFCYNVGPGSARPYKSGFTNSTLLKALNAGDYNAVPRELPRWVESANPNQRQGLINRRNAEIGMWARNTHVVTNTIEPTPTTAPAGKTEIGAGLAGGGTVVATGGAMVADVVAKISGDAERASWIAQNGTTLAIICGLIVLVTSGVGAWLYIRRHRG